MSLNSEIRKIKDKAIRAEMWANIKTVTGLSESTVKSNMSRGFSADKDRIVIDKLVKMAIKKQDKLWRRNGVL